MPEEVTNKVLLNKLSIENLISVVLVIFVSGGAWFVMADDVEDNTDAVQQVRAEQAQVKEDIGEIKEDVSGIKAAQEHQGRDLQRILRILERDPRADDR